MGGSETAGPGMGLEVLRLGYLDRRIGHLDRLDCLIGHIDRQIGRLDRLGPPGPQDRLSGSPDGLSGGPGGSDQGLRRPVVSG